MSSKTAALRLHVASALAARVASPFEYRDRPIVETVPAGIHSVDLLTGGFPRGSLTEIYGPPCSGRTSLLISALASRTAASEVCALVDAGYSPGKPPLSTIGYKQMAAYLRGECTLDEATAAAKQESRRLAKRQLTWFRREPQIVWLDAQRGAQDAVALFGKFFRRESN